MHLHTKLQLPNFNGPLVITVGLEVNKNVRTVAMLFYYVMQAYVLKLGYLKKIC